VIGTHSGSCTVYRAIAVAAGVLSPDHRPDFTDTAPWHPIGRHPQWFDPEKIVSLDPFGAVVQEAFASSPRESASRRSTSTIPTSPSTPPPPTSV